MSKARERLGWAPTVTFADGLERTIEWLKGSLDAYRPTVYTV